VLWAPPGDFAAVAKVMMEADPQAANRAFLEAMLAQAKKRKKKS
jgi:hypothetical protein